MSATSLADGMSVRKTAAKFDVNPSTVQRIARPFATPSKQASSAPPSQIVVRPGSVHRTEMPLIRPGVKRRPPGGGPLENRKFIPSRT